MDRFDVVFVVVGVLLLAGLVALSPDEGTFFGAVVGIFGFVAAAIAANHTVPRRPRLSVRYGNAIMRDEPVVWTTRTGGPSLRLQVYVKNVGRGPAEAVEVRFDRLGASHVFNESGNPNPDVDEGFHPPRFLGGQRVLNSGQEWTIAMLVWSGSSGMPTDLSPAWQAFARGMRPAEGVIRLREVEPPSP